MDLESHVRGLIRKCKHEHDDGYFQVDIKVEMFSLFHATWKLGYKKFKVWITVPEYKIHMTFGPSSHDSQCNIGYL